MTQWLDEAPMHALTILVFHLVGLAVCFPSGTKEAGTPGETSEVPAVRTHATPVPCLVCGLLFRRLRFLSFCLGLLVELRKVQHRDT